MYIVLYVDNLLVPCKVRFTIDDTFAILRTNYKDVQGHVGSKHSYLGMTMDLTKKLMMSITVSHFIDSVLANVNVLGVTASPVTERLFSIDKLLSEVSLKWFHSKVAQHWYLCFPDSWSYPKPQRKIRVSWSAG